jgi:DNA-binding NarL/FixJ family response regulator
MSYGVYQMRQLEIAYGQGDRARTLEALDRALTWAPFSKDERWLEFFRVELAREGNDIAGARARLDASSGDLHPDESWWMAAVLFDLAAATGDGTDIPKAIEHTARPACHHAVYPNIAVAVVDGALRAGLEPAEVRRQIVDPQIRTFSTAAVPAMLCDALLLAREGDHAEAARLFTAALADLPDAFTAPMAGYLRTQAAASLLAVGRRDEAKAFVAQAVVDLERWPGWRRDQLALLERRLAGSSGPGPEGELTAREREVAALLAEGLTNTELARRLFISPKTAAVHVSNILMKLGMTNRAEVAAWAVRTGVAAP